MKKNILFKGLASIASFLTMTLVGTSIGMFRNAGFINDFLKISTSKLVPKDGEDAETPIRFASDFSADINNFTAEEREKEQDAAALFAESEEEEGAVLLKNENNALPLTADDIKNVATFGRNSLDPMYKYQAGGGHASLGKHVTYLDALKDRGFKLNQKLLDAYSSDTSKKLDYDNISESPLSIYSDGVISSLDGSVAIIMISRTFGESHDAQPYYKDSDGSYISQLSLSKNEKDMLSLIKRLKNEGKIKKSVVLINSCNPIETSFLDDYDVDASLMIGGPGKGCGFNGVADLLIGDSNPSGRLVDTYATSSYSAPAFNNFGNIRDKTTSKSYAIYAENIYVGYKYYETRYYDSIVNPNSKANSTKGSRDGSEWKYDNEVVYPFGHGLSYLSYEQNIRSVSVDKSVDGNTTAVVEVKNTSDKEGTFLAQLYVQQPYTDYDKTNKVEKSAANFLSSKKVTVPAKKSATVEITVPTKYLASYDYTDAKTYILDEGDYRFTAASGAHDATNNFLTAQGYTTSNGMDEKGKGNTVTWNLDYFDKTVFATDHNHKVTNVVDNADLNYWLPGSVTYLSRQDWETTYPINYNEKELKIADSSKKDEWIKEMRGQQHMISDTGAVENLNGLNGEARFDAKQIGYDQLTNIDDPYWSKLVSQISADEAIGAVAHGGSQSDVLTNVDNPIVKQSEGVNGFTGSMKSTDGSKTYKFNLSSQTLLGTSFNPELAYDWGKIMGESGLWLEKYDLWGTGLTMRRTPYNGRNYEYISEDPMLANRIGYGILAGAKSKGIMCGPKHIGFNDQEHNRNGVSVFINEQKMRETDMRAFQGGLEDAGGLAVMVAFNRIGSTNASHSVGMLKNILRDEWGFKGIISTDMMNNSYYFNPEACIMATVTQMADFGGDNSNISSKDGHDATWTYLSVDAVKNDKELVNAAREALKYQLYTFANSAVLNISTIRVTPWWETALKAVIGTTAALTALAGISWVTLSLIPERKKEEK